MDIESLNRYGPPPFISTSSMFIKDYQCPDVGAFLSKILQSTSLDDFEVFVAASWHMWPVRNKSFHAEKV